MMRRATSFFFGSVFLLAGCASTPEGDATIVALSDLDNRPFAWVDDEGRARGRDVEMMEALAREVGRPLEWNRVPFDRLLDALDAGEGDVVCATLGITPERAERVDFSAPYFVTELAVVVRASGDGPSSIAELAGRRVAAGAGTTSERAVRAHGSAIGVFEAKEGTTTAQRLSEGDVDAAVMDGPAADAMVRASGGALRRLNEGLGAERYALAFRKGTALVAPIDAALVALIESGAIADLDAKHGLGAR